MEKVATDIYSFRELRENGITYVDMTCETPAGVWLIEFKLGRPAEEALAQIDARNYAEKYDFAGKTVRKLSISFSSEQRTIVDAKVGWPPLSVVSPTAYVPCSGDYACTTILRKI